MDYWNAPFYEVLCLGLHRGHILVDLAVALLVDHLSISATMTPSASLAASSLSRSRRRTFSWFAFPKNNKANRRVRRIFISLISFPPKSALEWNCIDKLTSQLNVVFEGFHGEDVCERRFAVTPCILSWESDGGPEKGPLMLRIHGVPNRKLSLASQLKVTVNRGDFGHPKRKTYFTL